MLPVNFTTSGVGPSQWFMPNYHMAPFVLDIEATANGTVTFSIETTMDDYWTPPGQVTAPRPPGSVTVRPTTVVAATTSQSLVLTAPCRGWRVNVTAGTGSVTCQAMQSGIVNY